jgi:hypothetical protein
MMVRRYGSLTPARRAALRRAQLASAAKRRGRRRQIATGFALGAGVLAVTAGGYAGHQGLKVHRGNQILRAQAMKNHPVSRSRGLSGIQIRTDSDKFYISSYRQDKSRMQVISKRNKVEPMTRQQAKHVSAMRREIKRVNTGHPPSLRRR